MPTQDREAMIAAMKRGDAIDQDATQLVVGLVVADMYREEPGVIYVRFTDESDMRVYHCATLRGDRGEGFLALRGATVRAMEEQFPEAILLTFDTGATLRVGFTEADWQDSDAKTNNEDAIDFYCKAAQTTVRWTSAVESEADEEEEEEEEEEESDTSHEDGAADDESLNEARCLVCDSLRPYPLRDERLRSPCETCGFELNELVAVMTAACRDEGMACGINLSEAIVQLEKDWQSRTLRGMATPGDVTGDALRATLRRMDEGRGRGRGRARSR